MTDLELVAERTPTPAQVAAAAATAPDNPFLSAAYAAALHASGRAPVLLALRRRDGETLAACWATVRRGRLQCTVEVESWPTAGDRPEFLRGFLDFCHAEGAHHAQLGTFAATRAALPTTLVPAERWERCEHRLDLTDPAWREGRSSNHRRNIARGGRAGLRVVRAEGDEALALHERLTGASLSRRMERGEEVQGGSPQRRLLAALLASGAATVHQARLDDAVLSSIVLLRTPTAAYYHSAGTLPEGMRQGASHFLVGELAEQLAAEGLALFNLSGAEPANEGLYRFKAGFGTQPVPLEAARYDLRSGFQRAVQNAALGLRALVRRSRAVPA